MWLLLQKILKTCLRRKPSVFKITELKVMMRSQFVHTERVHNFDGKGCGPKFALLLYLSLFCFFSVPTQWIEFIIRTHIEDTRKKLKQTKSQRQRALMKIRHKMRRRGKRHIERVYLGKRHRAQSRNTKKGGKELDCDEVHIVLSPLIPWGVGWVFLLVLGGVGGGGWPDKAVVLWMDGAGPFVFLHA